MSGKSTVLFDANNKTSGKAILSSGATTNKARTESPKKKDTSSKPVKNGAEKLDAFVEHSSNTLYKVKSVFPFDLFPNDISVDINQVHLIMREFFWSERIYSIRIENIIEVYLDSGPFFATLNITDTSYGKNVVNIKYLPKMKAKKLRRIIQGLMIVKKENIDLSTLGMDELISQLEQLGSTNP